MPHPCREGLILLAVGLTTLWACTPRVDPYLESLTAPLPRAAEACRSIEDRSARSSCLAELAERVAGEGDVDGALALCPTIDHEGWRWECHVRVVDAAHLVGEQAWSICDDAGALEVVCQGHATQSAITRLGWSDAVRGHERIRWEQVLEIVRDAAARTSQGDTRAPLEAYTEEQYAALHMLKRVGKRFLVRPFNTTRCGELSAAACDRAYRLAVIEAAGSVEDLVTSCGNLETDAHVRALGTPGWDPGQQGLARRALAPMCLAIASGERDLRVLRAIGQEQALFDDPGVGR